MKPIHLIITFILLTIFFFGLKQAIGEILANYPDKQSVLIEGTEGIPTSVTVINEWVDATNTVAVSASVLESPCNACLKTNETTDCQKYFNLCLDVK